MRTDLTKREPKTWVFYHRGCDDGFGAAWAAWKVLGDRAAYRACAYGDDSPLEAVLPDDSVYVVDFSFPRSVLERLARGTRQLVVLDHHKTAAEDLAGLPFATFDMEHSGMTLAWNHWHPKVRPPLLVLFIEDRDLWRFELPETAAVSAWLRSYPRDFRVWSDLSTRLSTELRAVVEQGQAILRAHDQLVATMADQARFIELGGLRVPAANAPVLYSEVGHELCKRYPSVPFAAYWRDMKGGVREWGLRGRKHGVDVSRIAATFGGGGHAAAAGFREDVAVGERLQKQ